MIGIMAMVMSVIIGIMMMIRVLMGIVLTVIDINSVGHID